MLKNRLCLLFRTAHSSSRGGFTLVELLVVIGIIAILAGVALGPITNGIKQAKHNATVQQSHQLGAAMFSYATDNTAGGNSYPSGANAYSIASTLVSGNYITDPNEFVIAGQPNEAALVAGGTWGTGNVSWTFTVGSGGTGGVTTQASDLIPLIFYNNGPGNAVVTSVTSLGAGAAVSTTTALNATAAPFGTDGIAVFYKGNNAMYIKATGTTGIVANFISSSCTDTTSYGIAK
jgi:prepilin-type N-terminal cleavage/methylation domain-containing protein